ncbi:hypothetical protein IFR05_005550 [Cadophora sp. M221]|nr:hypothetical protein IFR05_005550 [Cadophora sp. M221]
MLCSLYAAQLHRHFVLGTTRQGPTLDSQVLSPWPTSSQTWDSVNIAIIQPSTTADVSDLDLMSIHQRKVRRAKIVDGLFSIQPSSDALPAGERYFRISPNFTAAGIITTGVESVPSIA